MRRDALNTSNARCPARRVTTTGIAALLLALAVPASAQTDFTRHLDIYYGTWTVFIQGNPNPVITQTLLELSDHISDGMRINFQADAAVEARIKPLLPQWVDPPDLTNVEWILGVPENLPALDNFDTALAALGGSVTADSGFQSLGTRNYVLDEMVFNGATLRFIAEVSFYERNGSVTLSSVGKCPLSHGYWKNNLALWTVPSLTLGTLTYPKSALAAILGAPSAKDASIILGRQLIAAKLNVLYGADPTPVAVAIGDADALIGSSLVPSGVTPNSALGRLMTARASTLADFNNGQLTTICTP